MEIILFWYIMKKNFTMNFKERGLTVGDLTILLTIILFSFFIMNKMKESKTQKQITNFYQYEILKNKSE